VTHYTRAGDPAVTVGAQGTVQHFTPGAAVAGQWWRLFQSAQLSTLIEQALGANPGMQAAQASLRASEDELRGGYGVFYPQVGVGAAASRQRAAPLIYGQTATPPGIFNLFTLSASVSYALDLFGGERRQVEALGAQVDLQRAGEQATYLTLVSNLVNSVIAAAAYRDEITTSRQLIELQRTQVHLADIQARAGTAPYSNVLSLQSQLASYEATVPQLEQKFAQAEDLIASLAGQVPAQFAAPDIRMADLRLPADLPLSVPADLVRQRPDVLMAEATAHAASASVGVATAAMLPAVTLRADGSGNATTASALWSASGRAWDFGAQLSQPLLQGGALWYRRKAAIDNYREATALYRQTVLGAFQQVADTLRALEHDAGALQADDDALNTSSQALHLIQANYSAGLATYLDVLNADAQFHQAQIDDVQSTAVRYQDTVALYAALGGGWWNLPASSSAPPASFGAIDK
jgi:NodT family efflux transporter outer membrane factor (OMF) lipoprotein